MKNIDSYIKEDIKKEKMTKKQKEKIYKKIKKNKEKKIKLEIKDVFYVSVIFAVLLILPLVSQKFTDEKEEKLKPIEKMYDSFKELTEKEGGN